MPSFSDTYGFARADVHLGNWRRRPFCAWSFSHVHELVPVARIPATDITRAAFAPVGSDWLQERITLGHGPETLADFLARSQTDILLVQQRGQTLLHWHAPSCDPALPHIAFSITKSVTGMLCGIAEHLGLLDPSRTVGHYLPKSRAGAYGDCPVRHLLDMRVSLDFVEDYLDTGGHYARYRRAMLWNPADPLQPAEGLVDLLCTLPQGQSAHGGAFAYQSPNSDILGFILEKVTGQSYADFAATQLWQKMPVQDDGFITLDANGAPRGAGGLLCTAQDLARLGRTMMEPDDILPAQWLAQTWAGGDMAAWQQGDMAAFIPGGSYRNQWYRLPGPADALAGIGIHGQYLYLHPASDTVIVKLASQDLPQDDALDADNLVFLQRLLQLAGS